MIESRAGYRRFDVRLQYPDLLEDLRRLGMEAGRDDP
jgi:hypothetical protein